MKKTLTIIIKTVERCNINCTYCYFFNGVDKSFEKHAKYISMDTVHAIARFIRKGCVDLGITDLAIEFHGGEPMMQKKSSFDKTCEILKKEILPVVNSIGFIMQSNAMLVDYDWLRLLRKHNVGVGVSIDGTKEYHDKYRIDHQGNGTYDRTIAGAKLLQKYLKTKEEKFCGVGALVVINTDAKGKDMYRNLVDELGFKHIDFLLPHATWNKKPDNPVKYGEFLYDVFVEWMKDDNRDVHVRFLEDTLKMMLGKNADVYGYAVSKSEFSEFFPLLTISSNGDISPSDEFRSISENFMYSNNTVFNSELKSYLSNNSVLREIKKAFTNVPKSCLSCTSLLGCRGGHLLNRYNSSNWFDNPTVYCKAMKYLVPKMYSYIESKGRKIDNLAKLRSDFSSLQGLQGVEI